MNRSWFHQQDEPPRFRPGATGSARPNPYLSDEPPPDPPPDPSNLEELTRLSTTGSTRRRRTPRFVPVPTTITIKPGAVAAIVAILVAGLFLVGGVIVILQNWHDVVLAFVGIFIVVAIIGAAASQGV